MPDLELSRRKEIRKKNTKRKQMQHIVEKENGGLRK